MDSEREVITEQHVEFYFDQEEVISGITFRNMQKTFLGGEFRRLRLTFSDESSTELDSDVRQTGYSTHQFDEVMTSSVKLDFLQLYPGGGPWSGISEISFGLAWLSTAVITSCSASSQSRGACQQAYDRNPQSHWAVDSERVVILDQYIEFYFRKEELVNRMMLRNMAWTFAGGVLKRVRLTFSDGSSFEPTAAVRQQGASIHSLDAVRTTSIRLDVLSRYPGGGPWAGLSEVSFGYSEGGPARVEEVLSPAVGQSSSRASRRRRTCVFVTREVIDQLAVAKWKPVYCT